MIENYGVINDRSPHLLADLCEIISYFENNLVSRGDIETFINEKGGDGLFRELKVDNNETTENNSKIQALTEETFRHLLYRAKAFGDWYPFVVGRDIIELKTDITYRHKIYASLLGYSRLKMFSRSERIKFAAFFETVCYYASCSMFTGWSVFHFGSGGAHRGEFGNKLSDALIALSKKIKDPFKKRHIDEISPYDVGDAGIDIVAIKEWYDNTESVAVFFAQCAAQQENWPEKRFEAHHVTHEKYFDFFHDPGTVLFIPICFRNPDGAWVSADGRRSVLVDRLRILDLLDKYERSLPENENQLIDIIPLPFEIGCAASST